MRIFTILGLSATITGAVACAKFDANDLVIRDGKNSARLREILARHAYYGTIHAVQRSGKDLFVVYGTSEMNRVRESYIRWLHVRDGKIIEQQEGRQESMNSDGWTIAWHHGKLIWSTNGFVGEERQNMIHSIPMAFTWTSSQRIATAKWELRLQELIATA